MFRNTIIILLLNLLSSPLLWSMTLHEQARMANNGMRDVHNLIDDRMHSRMEAIRIELARISKLYDDRKMGQTTFETQKTLLMKELDDLQKRADQVGNAATGIVTNLFSAALAIDQKKQMAEEDRKTAIAAATGAQAVADEGAMKRLQFLTNPEVLKTGVKYGSLAILAGTAAFYGTKTVIHYVEQKLDKQPELAQETSRSGIVERTMTTIKSWWQAEEPAPVLSNDLVFAPNVHERLAAIGERTGELFEKGLPFQRTLLHGPPGTGKTAFARWLAYNTGMDYVIMAGSDVIQLPMGEDVTALRELFSWAKTSSKGMIIFIDEVDAIAFDRKRNPDRRVVILLNELLVLMSDPEIQRNCKVIVATNRAEDLDEALLSRCGEQIFIGLPELAEREKIFKIYLQKFITDFSVPVKEHGQKKMLQLKIHPGLNDDAITLAAEQTAGFSGRNIEQMVQQMQIECCFSNYELNKELFLHVVNTTIQDRAHQPPQH